MSDLRESTTIFYKLKLKRTRKPKEVFEKMAKSVKKRGATKSWICKYNEEGFRIDFGDEYSETFVISFDDKKKIGDRLIFEDMAIYSMVKNNTFNGMALPDIDIMHEDHRPIVCFLFYSFYRL